jgi:hypothetical protein
VPAGTVVGGFAPVFAGDFVGSTMLGFVSLPSAGGFGRGFWAIVLGGIDTVAETVSMTVAFPVTGWLGTGVVLEEIGDAGALGGDVTTLAGVLDAVADVIGLPGGTLAAGLVAATTATAADGQR